MTSWEDRVEEKLDTLLERTVRLEEHSHPETDKQITNLRLYVAKAAGALAMLGVGLEVVRTLTG